MIIEYKKQCPECGRDQIYKSDLCLKHAIRDNTICNSCKSKGVEKSEETRKKLSVAGINRFSKLEERIKLARYGENHKLFGKRHTEEFKRIQRIRKLERMENLGIPPCADRGSAEYFQYQNENGFRFIENYSLKGEGYIVDGYDPYNNIVCEYDTKYHFRPKQMKKDLIRQDNIIRYFDSIGKPLNSFIRVNADTKELHECIS